MMQSIGPAPILLRFEQLRRKVRDPMDTLVSIHSLLRWIVLLLGVVALAVGLIGWFGGGTSERVSRQSMLAYAISIDIQVLLGIIIWVAEQRWAGGGRQFQFEHPIMMLLALVIAHIAASRARRAPGPRAAARTRTIGTVLSLLLILIGIPWNR
jgi:hypothetical protein